MNNKHKLKSEYETLLGDENHNGKSKIRLTTYALEYHSKLMPVFVVVDALEEGAEKSCEEEAYKTCEELENMNHQ